MRNLRHRKEKEAATEKVGKSADHDRDLQELLDQELEALPDKYRAAIVLCDLEGMTVPAAAKQMGCPLGTLSVRLVRGRAMLGKRLAPSAWRYRAVYWQRPCARMRPRLVCRDRWWFPQFKPLRCWRQARRWRPV